MRAEGEKDQPERAQRRLYPQARTMGPIKVLKTNYFSSWFQRPGEKCGLNP